MSRPPINSAWDQFTLRTDQKPKVARPDRVNPEMVEVRRRIEDIAEKKRLENDYAEVWGDV